MRKKLFLNVQWQDVQQMYASGLFLKLLADVEGAVILLERGMVSQGRSMLRVAIECLIRLAKVSGNHDSAKAYAVYSEDQRRKFANAINNNPSPAFREFREAAAQLADSIGDLEDMKAETLHKWASDVKFAAAYDLPYRLYSREVHSSI